MRNTRTRKLITATLLGAVGFVLMFVDFSVPVMPGFIKMDFSDLPALLGSFALGPLWGVAVCLIKNMLHLLVTDTMGVGSLSNFLIGSVFVFCAGALYGKLGGRKGAAIGSVAGSAAAAVVSIFSNYYIVYPVYARLIMPMDVLIGVYKTLNPNVETLWDALIWFNAPFTAVKCLCVSIFVFLVYKKLSPVLKGRK